MFLNRQFDILAEMVVLNSDKNQHVLWSTLHRAGHRKCACNPQTLSPFLPTNPVMFSKTEEVPDLNRLF